jgi:glycosyltransferase involved in cell wall biosynthesis
LDILIDAMPQILNTYSDAVLIVIGDGPDRLSLELRSKNLSIVDHIIWLGQKRPEEVYALYSIMDIVAVPSRFEGFGLAAAEAMAAGLPVVASATDGLTEIIENGETGYLVPPGRSDALAASINKLLGNPKTRKSLGQKGRVNVQQNYSSHIFSKIIKEAYRLYAEKA